MFLRHLHSTRPRPFLRSIFQLAPFSLLSHVKPVGPFAISAPFLDSVSQLSGTTAYLAHEGIKNIGSYVKEELQVPPGQRCVVVSSESSLQAQRAMIVPHFLRKGGYAPVMCQLQSSLPLDINVAAVVEMAKRTGSSFIAAYGGDGVISVARAAAAVLANGQQIADYLEDLGGKGELQQPSVPFVAVPSQPASLATAMSGLIITKARFSSGHYHPAEGSKQLAVLDPSLSASMPPEQLLLAAYTNISHSIEGICNPLADGPTVALLTEGLHCMLQGLVFSLVEEPKSKEGAYWRALLLQGAAANGAYLSEHLCGATRGVSVVIASKYHVPYTAAIASLLPELLDVSVNKLLDAAEEQGEDLSNAALAEGEGEGANPLMSLLGSLEEEERKLKEEMAVEKAQEAAATAKAAAAAAGNGSVNGNSSLVTAAMPTLLLSQYLPAPPSSEPAKDGAAGGAAAIIEPSRMHSLSPLMKLQQTAAIVRFYISASLLCCQAAEKASKPLAQLTKEEVLAAVKPAQEEMLELLASPQDAVEALPSFLDFKQLFSHDGNSSASTAAPSPSASLTASGASSSLHYMRRLQAMTKEVKLLDSFKLGEQELQAVSEEAEVGAEMQAHVCPISRKDILEALKHARKV